MMYFVRYSSVLLAGALLAACSTQAPEQRMAEPAASGLFVTTPVPATPADNSASTAADYPAPSAPAAESYPAPTTTSSSADGRSETALASYQIAAEAAKQDFSPEAQLFNITPSQIMLNNLAGPPVLPGWFYTFKVPGERRQFIVQVVDGQLTGKTEAEPIEEPTPAEQPINIAEVKVDSPQVFELFEAEMTKQGTATKEVTYDLELVKLAGQAQPVWSVVDPETKQWLFSVDAVTGDVVPTIR